MIEVKELIDRLMKNNLRIATAESCTGGLLSGAITDIPGASEVFSCGIVSYSNEIKNTILKVDNDLLSMHGAVSPETAKALALGVLELSGAHLALATTGIAGPGGGSKDKPVGLVYVALSDELDTMVERHYFKGNRKDIRFQTVYCALALLDKYLNQKGF